MNPVFDVLLGIGNARLARALNVMGVLKPPRRDKLDEKSLDLLVKALWLLERLKNQPELGSNDLASFGACAAVVGHFAPFSELPLAHSEVASLGGSAGGATHTKRAQKWHTEARPHIEAAEKESQGLSPRKLAKLVIPRCKTRVGIDAMEKFIRYVREEQLGLLSPGIPTFALSKPRRGHGPVSLSELTFSTAARHSAGAGSFVSPRAISTS